ncbi:DNA-binding protein [Streptomyces spiroverticillatus]|uniref:MmcQ/YjbR family DNA-binding protein n=1 Tax=Streptomyces finlayi TaxID=67296 RepID=UPI00167B74F5|nr:MmcQ/YjbR family DNA-binding protein [Streptomyces finlayi]
MTPAQLRTICLGFNEAVEEFPFTPETSVFKVLGKVFALSALDAVPLSVNLKCEPENAIRLRAAYPAVVPGWHMNKRHWNTVTLDGSVPDRLVREMVEDSYDLVVAGMPRATRLRLDRA